MEELIEQENKSLKTACLIKCIIYFLMSLLFVFIVFLPIFRIHKSIDLQSILSSNIKEFEDILNGNLNFNFSFFKDFTNTCANLNSEDSNIFGACIVVIFLYIVNFTLILLAVIYFLKNSMKFFMAYSKNDISIYLNYLNAKIKNKEVEKKMQEELNDLSLKERIAFIKTLKNKDQRNLYLGKEKIFFSFLIVCFVFLIIFYFILSVCYEEFKSNTYLLRITGVNGFISIPIIFLVAIIGLVIAEKVLIKDKKL